MVDVKDKTIQSIHFHSAWAGDFIGVPPFNVINNECVWQRAEVPLKYSSMKNYSSIQSDDCALMCVFLWAQKYPKQVFLLASIDKNCPEFICVSQLLLEVSPRPGTATSLLTPRVNHFIRPLLVDIAIDSRYNGENCFAQNPLELGWDTF